MDKKLVKDIKSIHDLIVKAIKSCTLNHEGFVDCMDVGKKIANEGYYFEQKLSDIIRGTPQLFDTKLQQKGNGIIRVVRLHVSNTTKANENIKLSKYPNLPAVNELIKDWKIGHSPVVGQYYYNAKENYYGFRYIATQTFNELTYFDNQDVEIILDSPMHSLKLNEYYEFQWRIISCNNERGFKMDIMPETSFCSIVPKQLVNRLYHVWANCDPTISNQMKNTMKMVSTQLTASSDGTFIYELLQNANDYPLEDDLGNSIPVNVEFHITNDYLIYRHSGACFSPRNIAAISKLAAGEKKAKKNAIGYKGIGFKTIFNGNDYAYLRSGEYSLRFDASTRISREDPWQIMPIWTEYSKIDKKVNQLFSKGQERFRVQMAIRPKDISVLRGESPKSYEHLLRDIFKDERDILFVPNLHSVQIFIDGLPIKKCTKKSDNWVLTQEPYIYHFTENEIQEINKEVLASDGKIPDKYKNFGNTSVMFACKKDGKKLLVVENATVNCYLPTLAKFGFPFMFNTDMIPTGARDNIEPKIKLNERFAEVAGAKFFEWVKDLLTCELYDLESVFSLIPDFKNCKKEHSDYINFIEKFEDAFTTRVNKEQIVPVEQGLANVKRIIFDKTGLSSSDIITDEEFYKFTRMENSYLPLPRLRTDKNFKSFLERYAADNRKFTKNDLADLVANKDFQEWLKVQENNNKFLKFLLDNDYLEDLLDEKLFLEDKGSLQTACALYYDADEYLEDLQAFTNHIYFLSRKTREYFNGNEKWDKVIDGKFARFNPKDFVDNNLLSQKNKEETKEKLKDKNTSIHFFKFLAENVEFSQAYKDLPYISDEGIPVESFNSDFIFIENEEGKLQTKAKWLKGIPFSFISADYGEDVLNYFKNTSIEGSDVSTPTFGVLDYDKSVIIENVILNEKYAEKVNANQQKDDDTHKSFISFCYANKGAFNTGSLKQYSIKVNEKNEDGETRYELTEANVFFETPSYDAALAHPWIGTDWMFCLSNDLLSAEISTDIEQFKKFYEDKFGVKELTNQLFYDEIVSKNIDAILKSTSKPTTESIGNEKLSETAISAITKAQKCNFDFVDYLKDNINIVFKDNDFTKFNKLALIDYNGEFITNDSVIFFYNEVLLNFISKEWLPSNVVNMCSKSYGHSTALAIMQVNQKSRIKDYDFAALYNLVIVPNLTVINQFLDDKAVNLDFHKSIIANIGAIKDDDRQKISKAKVFIRGKKLPVEPASGHKIVSKTVEELVELSLVDYSELDLLDQDYHANEHQDYWQKALGNKSFIIKDFLNWLINNKESVATKLQDKNLNIKFWRWAKKNVKDGDISSYLTELPILVQGKDAPCILFGEIYLSDKYLDSPIESLITNVAPNASILAPDYIGFGEEKEEWVDFWKQLGVLQNEVEVLENIIRNRLATTEVSNLAELIYKNRAQLEVSFNDNLIGNLADIKLFGTDQQYRAAKDCVFVSSSNDEPFPYISIPNRVGSPQAGVNSFIGEIIQMHNPAHYVTDLHKWRQEKIEAYLALQNESKQTSVHMSLIKELAVLINANKDNLSALPKINDIHLLVRDNTYKPSRTLTEGSKYNPFFDFEACGITLDYISDSYLSCGESVIKLFNYLKVHHNLEESDLSYLSNYTTACYFWKNYLGVNDTRSRDKNIKHVMNFITLSKNPFNELACVPTLDGNVVKAESLYSLHIRDKVALLTDGEKLLPLDIVAEGVLVDENSASKGSVCFMDKLSFKNMLSVQHCFDALCNIPADIQTTKEKELRKELVKWIINQKNDISTKLAEYRANENALWYNGITQKQQVSKLYALNPKDNLEQYFSNNAKIIDASYVANKDNQLDAFAALGIRVISQTDIATVPSADKKQAYNSNTIKKDLKFYTLIISGIESPESWKNNYEEYCSKVDKMAFWTCSAIEKKYKYDGSIVKKLSGFYHEDGNDEFYYKGDLNSPLVFLDYIKGVKEYLGLKADIEIIKNAMFNKHTACDLIEDEYRRLLSDEEFVKEVRKTFPKFNHKDVIEPTTPPTIHEPATESVNYTRTESVNSPKVVEKQKEQEVNNEDSENTVHLSKAETNTLSQSEQIEAQLEAQKKLRSVKPMWKFPYNFAEVDEEGKPCCFSTFHITDEEGNNRDVVLKSYKRDDAPFSINPEEWDSIINNKAKILIYRGNDIVEIKKEDLVKNQNSIILRFSTENLDIEDRISQFSDLLHYFKQIHFDFESFNISKRAKSIVGITNKNQGIQTSGSDDEI